MAKSGVMDNISLWMDAKARVELEKSGGGKNKKVKNDKLDDANFAGSK